MHMNMEHRAFLFCSVCQVMNSLFQTSGGPRRWQGRRDSKTPSRGMRNSKSSQVLSAPEGLPGRRGFYLGALPGERSHIQSKSSDYST